MNHAQNSQRSRVFLLLILMICLLLPHFSAGAQSAPDGLGIELNVEPASLTAPGTVTVSARVSNAGTAEIATPLSLYDPDGKPVNSFGDGGMLLRLAPGEAYPWQGQYMVTQAQLDEAAQLLTEAGFVQYLPRRWAKPGCEDKFWQGAANGMDVLAFGLSAYTRLDGMITTNTSDLNTYLAHSADYEQITVSTVPVQTAE